MKKAATVRVRTTDSYCVAKLLYTHPHSTATESRFWVLGPTNEYETAFSFLGCFFSRCDSLFFAIRNCQHERRKATKKVQTKRNSPLELRRMPVGPASYTPTSPLLHTARTAHWHHDGAASCPREHRSLWDGREASTERN